MFEYNPKISIIIPAYNASNFLEEAIESALAQTYDNYEIIVINDGSKDEGATRAIAEKYVANGRIKYIEKENGGVSSALNEGIKNMSGEYFSWLSHDDMYSSTKLENQVRLLQDVSNKELLVMCGNRQINEKTEFINTGSIQRFENGSIVSARDALISLYDHGSFHGCSLLIPKTVFDKCGYFNEQLKYSQDLLMWSIIFLNDYQMIYVNENDVYGRVHSKQLTQTGKSIFYSDSNYLCDKLLDEITKKTTDDKRVAFYFGKYFAKYNVKKALSAVIKAGKQTKTLTFGERCRLRLISIYGSIRPFIRRVYYRLFKKVKTN